MTRPLAATSRVLLGLWLALALALTTVVAFVVPPRERAA